MIFMLNFAIYVKFSHNSVIIIFIIIVIIFTIIGNLEFS